MGGDPIGETVVVSTNMAKEIKFGKQVVRQVTFEMDGAANASKL
jgi:hypothetical protein